MVAQKLPSVNLTQAAEAMLQSPLP